MQDESADVTWSRASTFAAAELFDGAGGGEGVVSAGAAAGAAAHARAARVWIDLSSPREARLFLRDQPSRRFVVRAVALPSGLDEMGRETIGQIVRCAVLAVLAVLADGGDALSADEVRRAVARLAAPPAASGPRPAALAAVARDTAPPSTTIGAGGARAGGAVPGGAAPGVAREAPRGPAVEVAPFVTAVLFAPEAPLAEEVSLVAVAARPALADRRLVRDRLSLADLVAG